ncbi:MAG TPA: radical SAM protein, partial [Candidatus Acidoferrum sp.]|nr:radical SAM protein [Candidatus Acidoferrum sp.]
MSKQGRSDASLVMTLEKAARIAKCSLMPNRPYHVQWFLTNRCNYRCRSCNVWRSKQDENELSTQEVKKGLDILKNLGVIEVVLTGGAPLLRDDIGDIIDYASRFFVTTVYDNGSLAAEKIETLRKADFVAISLDTLDPEKNDHAKGVKGSWNKAMKSIETLHREGVQVSITPTISQVNLNEIVPLTKYFLQRDIPVWYSLYSYDSESDSNQLFKIGKKNEELEIANKENMIKL